MLSIFCAPSRYVQGRDATSLLGDEMRKLGLSGTALVIAGKTAKAMLSEVWQVSLSRSKFGMQIFAFGGECSEQEIERATENATKCGATVIVGAGGGKVIDTARAVAAKLSLPVVSCPTAASSDAPCSALSVLYTPDGQFDKYLFYPRNPDLVLVDTSIIARSPARLLVAGMGDALATWFEARTVFNARKANQVGGETTISARALAALSYRTLLEDGVAALEALSVQSVTPSLERLVEANTLLSGLGFESGGLAVAHSVHNGLTVAQETHHFLHGEKVAFGLLAMLVLEGQPQTEIDEVLAFCNSVGLPVCLSDVGLKDAPVSLLERIAERSAAPEETAHNEPFVVSPEAVLDAIRTADSVGNAFKARFNRKNQSLSQVLPL